MTRTLQLGPLDAEAAQGCGCTLRREPPGSQAVVFTFCDAHARLRVPPPTDPKWREKAAEAVVAVAAQFAEFTTDEVWAALGEAAGAGDPRAMGAVMEAAAARGAITKTTRHRPSTRPECHRRPVRIWRSLVTA
jgi:hypothetical protein